MRTSVTSMEQRAVAWLASQAKVGEIYQKSRARSFKMLSMALGIGYPMMNRSEIAALTERMDGKEGSINPCGVGVCLNKTLYIASYPLRQGTVSGADLEVVEWIAKRLRISTAANLTWV